jgi:tRNA A37 threonylcarbamoyladenosine modification protein TsaB
MGWNSKISGMSSLALLAAAAGSNGEVAAAVIGGHGEIFVQSFSDLEPTSELLNLRASEAAKVVSSEVVVGSAARQLVDARGWGEALDEWPSASKSLMLPSSLRDLPPKPVYARAPDAKVAA